MSRPKSVERTFEVLVSMLAVGAMFLAGCGSDDDTSSSTTSTTTGPSLEGTITVSAAASLNAAFTKLGEDFSTVNPDTEVKFNFDSSGTLSSQLLEGAKADLFASADEANMTKLTDEDLIAGEPTVFARNQLVIVTKPGNPKGIETLADLADAGTISLCADDAPCGKFANQILGAAGVSIPESSVTRGQNATATLTAVTQGDAVAGIVYLTDALNSDDEPDSVTIPEAQNTIATYPIGVLKASGKTAVAKAFEEYVVGDEGQKVLEEFGFLPPT